MHHDVIVIGGSYAGMAATLQLVRARRSVLVIDVGTDGADAIGRDDDAHVGYRHLRPARERDAPALDPLGVALHGPGILPPGS